jgi:uncharacterized protein
VKVATDVTLTGHPAQLDRVRMADVGDKLLDRFADCLSRVLAGGEDQARPVAARTEPAPAQGRAGEPALPTGTRAALAAAIPARQAPEIPQLPRPTSDPTDRSELVGMPALTRAAPLAGVLLLVWLLVRLVRRDAD